MGTFAAAPGFRSPKGSQIVPTPPGDVDLDATGFPIVRIQFGRTPWSDAELIAYLNWLHEWVLGGERDYALLMDQRNAPMMSATQRKLLIDHMNKYKWHADRYCVASAMVFQSALMRGFLTAIFWMFKPSYPTKVFATPEEALPWLDEQLKAPRVAPRPRNTAT